MTFIEFLKRIDLYEIVKDKFRTFEGLDYVKLYNLLNKENVDYDKLKKVYDDELGFKFLYSHLRKAYDNYRVYKELGIGEKIYFDTYKCFTRFIKETYEIKNRYEYDRYFRTTRQCNLKLFRIGELEYEIVGNKISIHIPSDANLDLQNIKKSIIASKKFFKETLDLKIMCYVCDSWMMSPTLKEVLSSSSNILKFQNLFKIISFRNDDDGGIVWVFKTNHKDIKNYKEETSLQRKLKNRLINGLHIGEAYAILKEDAL